NIGFATPFSTYARNDNQNHLAANLNASKTSSTAEFTNAILSLEQLPAAQIPDGLSQISGDALASFQSVGLQNAVDFTKGMCQRGVTVSTGSYGLWAQGLGSVNTMDADGAIGSPASRATTGGFQAGYDYILDDHWLVGFSGGYANTGLDVSDRDS